MKPDKPSSVAAESSEAARARRLRLLGILLMCGACACFAGVDSTAKYLGRHMAVLEVAWTRYISALALAFVVFNPLTRPGLLRTARPVLQFGRSALLLIQTLLNFLAVTYLQLDQTLAIIFSTPLLVAALAGPMLGERIGARRWAAVTVGLFGVIVVLQPGFGSVHPAVILPVLFAVCAAFYAIATRVVLRTDTTETTLFYSNLFGAVALTPAMPFVWTTPDLFQLGLMFLFGALASLGHFLHIAAHRHTPASVVAPFVYSQLIWVIMLGYALFGDVPNRWTLTGAAIVVASGLYLVHRERVRSHE